jgi:hypothetical protein
VLESSNHVMLFLQLSVYYYLILYVYCCSYYYDKWRLSIVR